MKPVVDEDLCIGCAACEDVCPEVFSLEDDGYSHVITPEPAEEQYACVREAIDACPTDAISISR